MSDNEHFVVGSVRSMIAFKPPGGQLSPAARRLLSTMDVVGKYRDGFLIATCHLTKVAELRDIGVEVIVLAADSNDYCVRVHEKSEADLVAFVDQRIQETRDDLAIADLGRKDDGGRQS